MDSKSGFGAAGDREMYAFKFSLLTVLLWFLRLFWRILIACVPNARSCTIPACFNTCDRKCINAVKFYRILRFLFSLQNSIVPKF